jgi:hypothetical protein
MFVQALKHEGSTNTISENMVSSLSLNPTGNMPSSETKLNKIYVTKNSNSYKS